MGGGEAVVGTVGGKCVEQARYEGVDLVVGAAGVFGEADDAYVLGLYVVGYGTYLLIGLHDDMTVAGATAGDENTPQTGEIAADHLHFVAAQQFYVGRGVVGEAVGVVACDYAEAVHVGVAYGEVPVVGVGCATVNHE